MSCKNCSVVPEIDNLLGENSICPQSGKRRGDRWVALEISIDNGLNTENNNNGCFESLALDTQLTYYYGVIQNY